MRSRWALPGGLLLLWVVALAWRVPQLGERPMHTDEAVHADKLNILWTTGRYVYDFREYHGPTLYYCTLPVLWLTHCHTYSDVTETTLRIVPALFGAALVLLLWLLADGLGGWATFWAAALLAFSPCLVFYSRYYIQETLLVFFVLAAIATAWRYARSGHLGWALTCGACLGLMHATKETWILSIVAMAAAACVTAAWTQRMDGRSLNWRAHIQSKHLAWALLLAGCVSVICFSSFFKNPRGPLDSLKAYNVYLGRGSGNSDHNHPWDYYLRLLIYTRSSKGPIFSSRLPFTYNLKPPIAWSEGFIVLLSLVGIVAALRNWHLGQTHLVLARFLAFYTIFLTVIYCLIPYKTPWCMMQFLCGMILLAGLGAVSLVRALRFVPLQGLATLLLLGAGAQLATQTYAANFSYPADRRNPYVYAHPRKEMLRFARNVEGLAQVSPEGHKMLISVLAPEYWPLPWYLRRFERVGYWNSLQDVGTPQQQAQALAASVIIVPTEDADALAQKLGPKYHEDSLEMRPEVFRAVFIRAALWDAASRRNLAE